MDSTKVRELMIPLSEYATVNYDATLYEAVIALKEAQEKYNISEYKHRAVLVLDNNGQVMGKLSQNDIIRGLEPGYKKIGDANLAHWGLSRSFIMSMMETHALWAGRFENICRKAGDIKVKNLIYTPQDGEYVDADATLDEAVHQLVMGHHQSLLVTEDEKVIGIIRLTDVFTLFAKTVSECK